MRKVQTYTSSRKLEVIRDILRGDKTLTQVCIKHSIAKSTVMGWKKQFDNNASMVFEMQTPQKEKQEDSPDLLKGIISRLTIENEILKKALSVWS